MSIIVVGGGGFIGSKLVRHFLEAGEQVLVIDDFSRGRREYVDFPEFQHSLRVERLDASDESAVLNKMRNFHTAFPVTEVWHMAANSDIPAGIEDAHVDMRGTFMTVFAVLEAMKELGIGKLAFASSSAIYGDHGLHTALHENIGPLLPISNYGAMKLAAEALISAATESWLERAWVFRFPNVVGVPATHGVILDFIRKLRATPDTLRVLGNGAQQKAYLHVSELLEAMLFIAGQTREKINLYNIGPDDAGCSVAEIAEAVVARVSPGAQILYGKEDRGWVGDVPRFCYCVNKLTDLGWRPRYGSLEAVTLAVDEIAVQEGF